MKKEKLQNIKIIKHEDGYAELKVVRKPLAETTVIPIKASPLMRIRKALKKADLLGKVFRDKQKWD